MKAIRRFSLVILCGFLAASTAPAAADELDDVQKKIIEQWDKLKSLSYDITNETEVAGEGSAVKSTATGASEMMRKGDDRMSRAEITTKSVIKISGQEIKSESKTLTISDGKYVYTLTTTDGQTQASKQKADTSNAAAGGKALFDALRRDSTLKLLPEETIDGKACYVIEASPKSSADAQTKIHSFDKEHGLLIRTTSKDKEGKFKESTRCSNIKVDPKLDAARFEFKAPAGVTVMDLTKGP